MDYCKAEDQEQLSILAMKIDPRVIWLVDGITKELKDWLPAVGERSRWYGHEA